MSQSPRIPLLAKVLGLLCLHLVVLAIAFYAFVRWQLGLGLDSLLSGSAGERIASFGDIVASRIVATPPRLWNEEIKPLAEERKLIAGIFDPSNIESFPVPVPRIVADRARGAMPPQRPEDGRPGPAQARPRRMLPGLPGERLPPLDPLDPADPPPPADERRPTGEDPAMFLLPKSRPAFLVRADNGDGYWAGVLVHLPQTRVPRRPVVLLIRADRLDGSGMFFDLKPWLLGGLAVLLLSLAFWTPFVWGITRYVRRLKGAADVIASGRFNVSLPHRGNDELGDLGRTIESMASRLDHFVSGQKRFLGDAAHELCAPLARIRTGLGVLEMKLSGNESEALASIESDTAELAALVDEILAFSRAGNRAPAIRLFPLDKLVESVVAREALELLVETRVPPGLNVQADPGLLGRAIGNLVRNAAVHAGKDARVLIEATESNDEVLVSVTDNGPGVPQSELSRLFEPFYRLDRSRSRDTGGSGLGLAIVRTAVEACGGKVAASLPDSGGFRVTLHLPIPPSGDIGRVS